MTDVQVGKTNFKDLALSSRMYEQANNFRDPTTGREDPLTFTDFLELEDPSDNPEYERDPLLKGTDAFQRQLQRFDIRTHPSLDGSLPADRASKFWGSEQSAILFPEWVRRVWFAAQSTTGRVIKSEGERFYMSSSPLSDVLYPDFISTMVRQKQVAPAIPLSMIIARTETIDSGAYVSYRLTDSETARQLRRVGEGAEVPEAELTGSDETIRMYKYGRSLKVSYEVVRRLRVDRLALHLALLAIQTEVDKVATAIDTAIAGDGNAGTSATNYDLNGDLGGTVSDPKVADYFAWRMKWPSPYNCNVILAQEADLKTLLVMDTGSANVMFGQLGAVFGAASGIGTAQTINPQLSTVMIGWTSAATANKWLGMDNRFALEMVVEAGAMLTETDRLIRGQFNRIVMTESLNFAVLDVNASRTLDLST